MTKKNVKKKILIVEDSKDQLLRYTHLVSKEYEAFGVSNFDDAKSIIFSKSIDILITDIHLSNSAAQNSYEGMELIEYTKQNYPEVLIIAMSSDPKVETYHNTLKKGAQHFLRKPILNISEINLAIEVASERKKFVRDSVGRKSDFRDSVIMSEANKNIAKRLAENLEIPVLINGETGTGKEIFARLIHSYREDREATVPFIAVNCATLNKDTAASILFGHKKGSFTGALETTEGYIGEANGGILFLDEIHHLTSDCQARLLRVLNDGSYTRFGDNRVLKSDFQVLAASTKSLDKLVDEGEFLLDLRMRLTGIDIHLKPLRERVEEIPRFLDLFLSQKKICIEDKEKEKLNGVLKKLTWKGNVRELLKVLQLSHFNASLNDEELSVDHLPTLKSNTINNKSSHQLLRPLHEDMPLKVSVEQYEKSILESAIKRHKSISEVCRHLKIGRSSLDNKRIKYDLE